MRFAFCATLQGTASFFMDDNHPFRVTLIMILEMFDRKT